jgi:hypothetical protein
MALSFDSLGTKLGFEHAGVLGERVDSFASSCGNLLLELQVQATTKLELAILLDLGSTTSMSAATTAFTSLVFKPAFSAQHRKLQWQSWNNCRPSWQEPCWQSEVKQQNDNATERNVQ